MIAIAVFVGVLIGMVLLGAVIMRLAIWIASGS